MRGGPVRVGFVGLGGQGRTPSCGTRTPPSPRCEALCDINPDHLAEGRRDPRQGQEARRATHYDDWKEMLQKEDLEAVVLAPPLWLHADMTVACLEAGKHVLCEKMMAWDDDGCRRMQEAAQKTGQLLEIGYQRFYNPVYQAAYEGIVKAGLLGDVYHARLVWHRNGTWRRKEEPPRRTSIPRAGATPPSTTC